MGTFCPPTADGTTKAGFKVRRLSPGIKTICRLSSALKCNFASMLVKALFCDE
ncbi:MAG: hypothetical protein J6B11_07610 [Spirochaetales bacterium]|nr:hypothetical protein [Spirochaetales bacterium]